MKPLLLWIVFLSLNAFGAMDFCEVIQDSKTIKTIPVPENVNYFIRGAPETGEIGFATARGNVLLDSKTGKAIKVPGIIDPILTPDGKVLVVPQELLFDPKTGKFSPRPQIFNGFEILQGRVRACTKDSCMYVDTKAEEVKRSGLPYVTQVMTFYSRDSLEKPLFIDKETNFSYQSLGKLHKRGAITSYRMIFETTEGIQSRDYQYNEQTQRISPSGSVRPLCKSLRGYLPAQRKSGDEYSAYDAEKGETHVFSIGKSGKECTIKETIPGMVGKIDFSPDGKKLLYHVDKTMDDNRGKNIIDAAKEKNNIESILFDRELKRPAIVAKSSTTNSYYPIFLDDNTLAYIDSTKAKDYLDHPKFSVKIASLEEISTPKCARCYERGSSEEQIAALIGIIRDSYCEKDSEFYFKNGIPSFSNLRVSQCQAVVESCDSSCLSQIKEKIERVSRRGGFSVGNVPLKTVQAWNVEMISKLEKKDLTTFCHEFIRENAAPVIDATQPNATK